MTHPLEDAIRRREITREMALFAESGRPIHAWSAYYWIRQAGLPVPPWFLEYLDGCAERLMKSPLEKPEQVAEAFEMGVTGRKRTDCQRLKAVEMFHALKAIKKPDEPDRAMYATDKAIYDKVAKQLGVNWTYVRNACLDWRTKK